MPGMEVFTISGAGLGYDAVASAIALDRKRAAAARGGTSASAGSAASPAIRLQNALKALGDTRGDSNLNVAVDGAIGPGTVKALNYALANIIGAGPVARLGARFQQGKATKIDVQNNAAFLAQVVEQAVRSAGGNVPAPTITHRAPRGSSAAQAAAAAAMAPPSDTHPNLIWIVAGAGLLVMAIGFMAARRRAATA